MKKQLLKILMLLFLIGNLTFSEYVVKDGKVFYNGKEVWVEDMKSFRILNDKIAADSQNVYFRGYRTISPYSRNSKDFIGVFSKERKEEQKEIKYDVKKIELIPSREKDRYFYFFKYNKKIYAVYGLGGESFFGIQDVDYETFKEVSGSFVKDKNKVYFVRLSGGFCSYSGDYCQSFFLGMPEIKGIVPKNFKVIIDNSDYDKIFVENDGKLYFMKSNPYSEEDFKLEELKQVDVKTFKPLEYKLIKDKNNVYFFKDNKFIKFEKADANTFEVIGNGYARDKSNIYFLYPNLEYMMPIKMEADRKSFNLIKVGEDYTSYAKDRKNIYCEGRLLEDVDYKTFKVFKEKNENGEEVMKIKDKNHEYDEYCQIKDKNKF